MVLHPIVRVLVCVVLLALLVTQTRAEGQGSERSLGPDGGWVIALAASPAFSQDGTLWAAVYGGRVFASHDGGVSWAPSRIGISDPVVTGLAVSPDFTRDGTVYAAADDGVFRSTDGGLTWTNSSSGLGGHACRAIALDPGFGSNRSMYVATDGGVFRSNDAGIDWTPTPVKAPIISLAVGTGGLVLAGMASGGVERSVDGGVSWTPGAGFPSGVMALSLAIATGGTMFAGTDAGILRSQDEGSNWQSSSVGSDRIDTVVLSPSYASDATAFAGSSAGHGVFITTDGGDHWRVASGTTEPYISALTAARGQRGEIEVVAGTVGDGIAVSHDLGAGWIAENAGLAATGVRQLSVQSGTMFAATLSEVSARSLSSSDWSNLHVPSRFVTSGARWSDHVFVGTSDRGLQISYDGGGSWHDSPLTNSEVSAVQLSPQYLSDETILVASDYVYRSTDSGLSWQRASGMDGNDVRRFAFSPQYRSDHTVFAATINHGVYRSVDGGMSWTAASSGLPGAQVSDVLPSREFGFDGTLYAATNSGIYTSENGAGTWFPLAAQPDHRVTSALAWSASGGLLLGTEKGIYVEKAGTWQPLDPHWDEYVTDIEDDNSNGSETVYVGTLGDGVWSFPLTAVTPSPTPSATDEPSPTPSQSRPTPSSTPATRTVHKIVRAWVMPKPTHPGAVALLRIQGPAGSRAHVAMAERTWRKQKTLFLDTRGIGAVGFVVPPRDFSVTVTVRNGNTTASTHFVARVSP